MLGADVLVTIETRSIDGSASDNNNITSSVQLQPTRSQMQVQQGDVSLIRQKERWNMRQVSSSHLGQALPLLFGGLLQRPV